MISIGLCCLTSGCKENNLFKTTLIQGKKINVKLWDDYSSMRFKDLLSSLENKKFIEKNFEQLALIALTHGEPEYAKTILSSLTENTLNADYYYYLTEIAINNEEYDEAHKLIISGLSKAKQHDKKLFYLLRVEILVTLGEFNQAQETLNLIKQVEPNNIHAQYLQAKLYLSNSDCKKAIASLEDLIQALPSFTQFYSPLASAYRMCGEFELADKYVKYHSDAVLLFPNRLVNKKQKIGNPVSSLKNDIKVEISRRNYSNAIQLLLQLKNIDPNDDKVYINLGSMYYKMKDYDKARKAYLSAYTINPLNIKASINLGIMNTLLKDYISAEINFQKANDINPNHIKVLQNLAGIKLKLNKPNEAEQSFLKALKIDSFHYPSRRGLTISLCMQNKQQDALEHLENWLLQEPKSLVLKHLQIKVLLQNINIESEIINEQLKWLLNIIREKPDLAELYVLIEIKYGKKIDFDEAIQAVEDLSRKQLSSNEIQKFRSYFDQLTTIGYLGTEIFYE
jgi:superkiller protein 3